MSTPFKLWLSDLHRGHPEDIYVAGTTQPTTAVKAVNGDPADKWTLLATSGTFVIGTTGSYTVRALGIAGHVNLKGASVEVFHGASSTGPWGSFGLLSPVPGPEDLIIDLGAGASNLWRKVTITGAPSLVEIGELCFLTSYGYDADGDLNTTGGAIELKNEGSMGLVLPIERGIVPAETRVVTPSGFQQVIRTGRGSERWGLNFELLRGADDLEWWKIVRSYNEPQDYRWTNPAWYKGVWLTDDQFAAATPRAWYLLPEGPPQWSVTQKGGRISGALGFTTLPNG